MRRDSFGLWRYKNSLPTDLLTQYYLAGNATFYNNLLNPEAYNAGALPGSTVIPMRVGTLGQMIIPSIFSTSVRRSARARSTGIYRSRDANNFAPASCVLTRAPARTYGRDARKTPEHQNGIICHRRIRYNACTCVAGPISVSRPTSVIKENDDDADNGNKRPLCPIVGGVAQW